MDNIYTTIPGPVFRPVSTTPLLTCGVYNSSIFTVPDGVMAALQVDQNGNLKVNVASGGGSSDINIAKIGGIVEGLTNPLSVELSDGTNPFGTALNPLSVNVISGGGSNASVGANNAPAPVSATEIGTIDGSGKLQGASVTNPVPVSLPVATVTTLTPPTAAAIGAACPVPPTAAAIASAIVSNPPSVGIASGQKVEVYDGTNTAAVKAASTAAAVTDPALVVALSPNSPAYIEGHNGVALDAVLAAAKPANVLQVGGNDGTNAYAIPLVSGGGKVAVSASIVGSTPSFIQGTPNPGSSSTIAYSSPNTAGNLLVLVQRGIQTTTVTDTQGNVWTSIVSGRMWYCAGCKGGANTVNLSASIGPANQLVIAEYSGVAIGQVPEVISAGASGTSNAATSPSITTVSSNDLLVSGISNETSNGPGYTWGSGFGNSVDSNGNASIASALAVSPGSYSSTVAIGSSVNWTIFVVAFKPFVAINVSQGIPAPNNTLAWYTSPQLNTDGTQNNLVGQRTPTIFKTAKVSATTAGNFAVWTPASGKKFRLMRFQIQGVNLVATAATVLTVSFQDNVTGMTIGTYDVLLPTAVGATGLLVGGVQFDTGWIDLGNGIISAAANNVLNLNIGATITGATGSFRVNVCGTEE